MIYYRINLNEQKSIEPEDLTIRKETKKKLRKINVKGRGISIEKENVEKSRKYKDQPGYFLDKRWKKINQLYVSNGIKNEHYNIAPQIKEEIKDNVKNIKMPENAKKIIAPVLASVVTFLVVNKIQNSKKTDKQKIYNKTELKNEFEDLYKEHRNLWQENESTKQQQRQLPKNLLGYALMALAPVVAAKVYDGYQQSKFMKKTKDWEKKSGESYQRAAYEKQQERKE